MKIIISLFILIIHVTHGMYGLSTKNVAYIKIHSIEKTDFFPLKVYISHLDNNYKELFITCSYGNQDETEIKDYTLIENQQSKEIMETQKTSYYRTARNENHAIKYALTVKPFSSQMIKDKNDAITLGDIISFVINPEQESPVVLNYYVSIPASSLNKPGIYEDVYTLFLYEGSLNLIESATFITSKDTKIHIKIPSIINTSFQIDSSKTKITTTINTNIETILTASQEIENKNIPLSTIQNKEFILINTQNTEDPVTITISEQDS